MNFGSDGIFVWCPHCGQRTYFAANPYARQCDRCGEDLEAEPIEPFAPWDVAHLEETDPC